MFITTQKNYISFVNDETVEKLPFQGLMLEIKFYALKIRVLSVIS
jgi:hypothetical protein